MHVWIVEEQKRGERTWRPFDMATWYHAGDSLPERTKHPDVDESRFRDGSRFRLRRYERISAHTGAFK